MWQYMSGAECHNLFNNVTSTRFYYIIYKGFKTDPTLRSD